MRKLFVSLFVVTLLLAVTASPATACYSRCENNQCVLKGFVTNQDCYQNGQACIDVPVYPGECSAPKESDSLADLGVIAPEQASVCTLASGG